MNLDSDKMIGWRQGLLSLSPVILFLLIYLVVSIAIGDFYKMPFSVALLIASVWSVVIYRGHPIADRIEVFSKAAGHSNIIYMIWIFVLAGAYASLATKIGAVDATVAFTLRFFPSELIVPGLFIAACFISFSIGTSVGTVVALTPLAVNIAETGGGNVPFFVAVVLGGAFFGDNLSFISDTTIAATRSQGCDMRDKFRANLWIVLPAALITLLLYALMPSIDSQEVSVGGSEGFWLMVPYLVIIGFALSGINVTIVLLGGIISALIVGLSYDYDLLQLAGFMGEGVDSMGNLIIITLLSAGMLGVIKASGGIQFLLQRMTKNVKGLRGAQTSVVLLSAIVNLCTANNTVAIITVGGIARDISMRYGVDSKKVASLLDTATCIVQCLIPYGAQTLLATSLAGISPAAPFVYLYYPALLMLFVALSIICGFPKQHLNRSGNPNFA